MQDGLNNSGSEDVSDLQIEVKGDRYLKKKEDNSRQRKQRVQMFLSGEKLGLLQKLKASQYN